MKTIEYKNHTICYDSYNLLAKQELQDFLKEEKLERFFENIKESVVLVLG